MQIYAEHQVGGEDYALSFNNGTIVIKGNTSIYTTSDEAIAFDVCKFSSYPGVTVTFDESYTGTINGVILYDSTDAEKHQLRSRATVILEGCKQLPGADAAKSAVAIWHGYFAADPSGYTAQGYAALPSTEEGYAFMVGEMPKPVVEDVEPAAGAPVVDVSEIAEEYQTSAKEVARVYLIMKCWRCGKFGS